MKTLFLALLTGAALATPIYADPIEVLAAQIKADYAYVSTHPDPAPMSVAGAERLQHNAEQLKEINARLASPPDFDLADADRLGLFVAGRLAARHGVQVELIPSAYRGTKAVVILPENLITAGTGQVDSGDSALRSVARLNVASPEALSLVGATAARPGATSRAGPGTARSARPSAAPAGA